MKPLFIESPGVAAPGLAGWPQARAVLCGEQPYAAEELSVYQPNLLPPNERRRATPAVRLAFRIAEEAVNASSFAAADLAGVFATSEADTSILHRICSALAEESRAVSPTDFHNSVHNAAAGYWSIAANARLPSVTMAAYDATFAAGLLEAFTLAHGENYRVLLAAYDLRPPEPLFQGRSLPVSAGVALILTPQRSDRSIASLVLSASAADESRFDDPVLEALRLANPALRALPLLQLLALAQTGDVVLAGVEGQQWRAEMQSL